LTRAFAALVSLLVSFMLIGGSGIAAQAVPTTPTTATTGRTLPAADCPPGVSCEVVPAALTDGGCNYSKANRPTDLPIYGINEHTTEGTLQNALDEAQDTDNCVSWNYLVDQTGKVYVSVPPSSLAYDVGNWWANGHYVQVEHIGYAEDCTTITPAEYKASVLLDRYLINRYHIKATSATITGHDSYPATSDRGIAAAHWDPGVCWPWTKFLKAVGAPIVPTAAPGSPVVTIRTDNSRQPVQNCPGANFTNCTAATQDTTNFVALYTQPSTSAPLLSDPYLHPDGTAGSTAMQDWGDKAPTGHSYVVAKRQGNWTEIWYGGQLAWFQNAATLSVPTKAAIVTPKSSTAVLIYGRPLPEASASGWANIPYDQQVQAPLTKYSMLTGQQYVVAQVPTPRNDYAEGCNKADCSGPGDGTVVIGDTKYIEIWWNHRIAFVQADEVRLVH
jgi:hypothetical protein